MPIPQVSEKITALLADGYLVNPQVNVFVTEFRSQKVVVLGRVKQPGLIELSGSISLLELISKAGGLEIDAGDTATIKRQENGRDTIIPIDLLSLIEGGDLSQNLAIQDGDTVVVSKAGMCYVTGEVEQPGSYPCGEGATVLKLVALANGFTGKASKSSVRIVRVVNDKKTVLKDVDLDTTLVFDNDVIVVPESFF
jgi:polysaccharide export outer membrane protein